MTERYDAALRINGEIVLQDRGEEIDADLRAELEFDAARDAVVAAAWEVYRYFATRGPLRVEFDRTEPLVALERALERHGKARSAYPNRVEE